MASERKSETDTEQLTLEEHMDRATQTEKDKGKSLYKCFQTLRIGTTEKTNQNKKDQINLQDQWKYKTKRKKHGKKIWRTTQNYLQLCEEWYNKKYRKERKVPKEEEEKNNVDDKRKLHKTLS